MERITVEMNQPVTDRYVTDQPVTDWGVADQPVTDRSAAEPKGAGAAGRRGQGRRRRVCARLGAGAAAFALTSSFGAAGAHASTLEATGSGFSQDEYLEMFEELAERLGDVEGFEELEDALGAGEGQLDEGEGGDEPDSDSDSEGDVADPLSAEALERLALAESDLPDPDWEFMAEPEVIFDEAVDGASFYKDFSSDGLSADPACEDAMGAIDDLEEDAQAAVAYEAAAGDEEVSAILVSTPEEHDFFEGYYQDVVDECGTFDLGDGEIEFQLTESAEGVQVRIESSGREEWFYMAGQSFGANHVMVVGEAPSELDDYEDILADQVELMADEVG